MRYQYIISISVFDKYVSILNLHLCYSQLEIVFRWNSGFLSEAQHHLRMLAASTEPKIPLSLQPATTDSRVLCVAPTTRLKLSVKASKGQTCSTFLNIFLWSPCVIRPNMFLIGKVCALLSNLPTWFLLHFVLWCILAYLHTCQPRICWYKKVWQTQTWTAFSDIFKNTKTSGVHDYWGTHDLFWFMLHHFVHLAVAQIQQTWLNHKIMKFAFTLLLLPACSFTCWRHHRWVCKGFLLPTPAPWSFKYHHFVYGQFGTLHMPECHFLHAIGHSAKWYWTSWIF